jgi:predicted transcriptional regulator
MERKIYTTQELFSRLPISLSELARRSKVSEVTAAKIRDGKTARLHTINKLLATFSEIYGIPLSLDNVIGFNVMKGRYGDGKLEGIERENTKGEDTK